MKKSAARKKSLPTSVRAGGTPPACGNHPRPWRVDAAKGVVLDAAGDWVMRLGDEDLETAELIVAAVNLYERLSQASGNFAAASGGDMRTILQAAHRLGVLFDRGGVKTS